MTMEPYRTDKIDTPAGTYTVELHYDEDSPNPLEDWDHEGMAFYVVGNRESVMTDTLKDADDAGNALRTWINDERSLDEIERRFAKWKAITGSPWILVTGSGFSSYQSWGWMVLVDTSLTYRASDGKDYLSLPYPVAVARDTMESYQTWADGGVCGFITKSPNDNEVESAWGFYDDDDALEEGKAAAESDAADRLDAANLVGAGFMGIV